jgi:hypothetical protein
MGLSRLENFLKNVRGNILYVSPNDLDATDSVDNKGNSLTRPFKTIQRALIESARFSYQQGLDNDRFGNTTILLYPGEHIIDNRPGWIPIPDGVNAKFRLRDGTTSSDFPAWDLTTTYDLNNSDNALYKLNSVHGGVIMPRGTSLVGLDLRKTKIRPKYVPSPTNATIDRTALFRVTGACYFWQFTIFDADPNGTAYLDYTANQFVPNFSHNKLTCFEYADGVNPVKINDSYNTYSSDRTDLQMYYEKIGLAYGTASGREIQPDYPSSSIDIQPKIDEYRIVGSTGKSVGISSIKAGNGSVTSDTITVTTTEAVAGLDVDTPFVLSGITAGGYNGKFVVSEKLSSTQFKYEVQNAPANALPTVTGGAINLNTDTVTSASPYMFNLSLRSVFGMNGLHADGQKATGFKSMVVAQFTGIGLQKDDNAFLLYNSTTGVYDDATVPGNENLSTNSRSIYKPAYSNFHIKCSNNSVIQAVSIFAIGFTEHFVVESGGDMSITNSNSNFGARALNASGFRPDAFSQDDKGYITHIIPPKEVPIAENAIEFTAIDVTKTVGVASTAHLYLFNEKNIDSPPENVLEGYRVGAKQNDQLSVLVPAASGISSEYSTRIVMPNGGITTTTQYTSEKLFRVDRSSAGINSITSNVITLTEPHTFENAESVRVLSDNGRIPDGLDPNIVYFVITNANATSGLTTTKDIKLAKTETDAKNASGLTINNLGGSLKVVSRVSDKNSGDIGHPIQYSTTENQWFINVSTASTERAVYDDVCIGLGVTAIGESTPRSFIKRKSDSRAANDTIYRFRYVIPASSGGANARPPSDGFILQESNTSIGSTDSEVQTYFGSGTLNHENEQRNFRFIAHAHWSSNVANVLTELPHDLSVDSRVELINIKSGINTTGAGNSGFNGTFHVTGITSAREFTVGISTDPGSFTSDTLTRTTSLPHFKRKNFETTYFIQDIEELQQYKQGEQDGVYYLTPLNATNKPAVDPFTSDKFSQNVTNLFPQVDRDTPVSDPDPAVSYARSIPIGEVIVDDVKKSITRETIDKFIKDVDVGIGLTNLQTDLETQSHTFNTKIDHGLNRVVKVSIANSGDGYGTGSNADYYNAKLVGIGTSTTGSHATAKVSVDATGGITDVTIMDGGSAYGIGNTMNVVGIATTTTVGTYTPAVVQVTEIYDNVGDVVRLTGVTSETYNQFNSLYRIAEIGVGAAKSFRAASDVTLSGVTTAGIGTSPLDSSAVYVTGESLRITNLSYETGSGIATLTSANNHGLRVNSKIRINTGITTFNGDPFEGSFVVTKNVSATQFAVRIGAAATTLAPTSGPVVVAAGSSMFAFREGFVSSDGIPTIENESLNGRMQSRYAGITTTLSAAVSDAVTTSVSLTNVGDLGIRIGDYLMIDDEVVRVKGSLANPATNPLTVFRAVLGTRATTHVNGTVVRRIKPYPVELRRHSINRASGHTWEYVGYGPGNYSTALPERQDREITDKEELLAQTFKKEGGVNYFTGMNDKGIAFAGNKKVSTVTGKEEVFDTPIRTVTGEDISNRTDINLINATEGTFTQSIRVDGGDEGKAISEFTGPVVFSNKVTSTSTRGLEANSLFIQGDATVSRKYTVGIATPTDAGTPGDIVYDSTPTQGQYLGWVYTTDKDWKRFSNISLEKEQNVYLFDKVSIGTTNVSDSMFRIGAGSTLFAVNAGLVTATGGINIGVAASIYSNGNASFSGIVTAVSFTGNGANITNINVSETGWSQVNEAYAGAGNTGIYAFGSGDVDIARVGIGTSVPHFGLDLGDDSKVGTGLTNLVVRNKSKFIETVTAHAGVDVVGVLSARTYELNGSAGIISAGIVTATTMVVGASGTAIQVTSGSLIGFGTASPRSKVDIDGRLRVKSLHENVEELDISSGNVNVDLAKGQSFNLNVDAAVTGFTVINPPAEATAFTIKVVQGSTAFSVGIDTFTNSATGAGATVYWPGGNVPVVTQTAGKMDIYSFKSFDSCKALFGITGGQNFSN